MREKLAISVQNLSKEFSIHKQTEKGLVRQNILALDNISFEVLRGESVGIIGSNGSGKSTLLKILAGVTFPSSGQINIRGKVASILDIGAGFHPDLSGRENVLLNGQLLGFKRKEVLARFDEIVLFSGIEKFIDEPVKNYSSGMYLRLAFSIMANLEFDIYLLDEVLSVGDAAYRNKIKDKIQEIKEQKKTILYVSHNLNEIIQDYDKGIILQDGILHFIGNNNTAVKKYISELFPSKEDETAKVYNEESKDKSLILKGVEVYPSQKIKTTDKLIIKVLIEKKRVIEKEIIFGIVLFDSLGNPIFTSMSNFSNNKMKLVEENGVYNANCEIPANFLAAGVFVVDLYFGYIAKETEFTKEKRVLKFTVEEVSEDPALVFSIGSIRPKLNWYSSNTIKTKEDELKSK